VAQDAITPQKDGGQRIPITTPKTATTISTEATSTTTTSATTISGKHQEAEIKTGKRSNCLIIYNFDEIYIFVILCFLIILSKMVYTFIILWFYTLSEPTFEKVFLQLEI
jgi:hypothetical protein